MGINCIWNGSKLDFKLAVSICLTVHCQLAPYSLCSADVLWFSVVFCVRFNPFSHHFKYWTMKIMS